MRISAFRAPEEFHAQVRKLSRKLKVSKSEVLRTAVSLLAVTHNV